MLLFCSCWGQKDLHHRNLQFPEQEWNVDWLWCFQGKANGGVRFGITGGGSVQSWMGVQESID